MEGAEQLLAAYDPSDSWLLSASILPTEVMLDCDFRVRSETTEREYAQVRLRLRRPEALRVEFAFPNVSLPADADDLGSIETLSVDGPVEAAAVRLTYNYGSIETSRCDLLIEPLHEHQ